MTNEPVNAILAMNELERFYVDLSRMLQTVEEEMVERSWMRHLRDATAMHDRSYSLYEPEKWLPYYLFRLYRNDSHPNALKSMSVIFDLSGSRIDVSQQLTEPLITCSHFQFSSPVEESSGRSYYPLAAYPVFSAGFNASNSQQDIRVEPEAYPDRENWLKYPDFIYSTELIHGFTLPLGMVQDRGSLQSEVIDKLIALPWQ